MLMYISELENSSRCSQIEEQDRVHVKTRMRSSSISWQKLKSIVISLARLWGIGHSSYNFGGNID